MSEELIVVRRAGPLHGEVVIPGAKNSVLKLMAAALLADGSFTLTNVPNIADVGIMAELLSAIGLHSERLGPGALRMVNSGAIVPVAPYDLVERIRASINVLGPLLGRCGHVSLSLPGGDDFGSRPIDMHLKGLEAMGATFELRHGVVEASVATGDARLHGAEITLDFPSVGATENILTAAVHAKGTTIIDHAAREPEIADLCNFLVAMGADSAPQDWSFTVSNPALCMLPTTRWFPTVFKPRPIWRRWPSVAARSCCVGHAAITWRFCCVASTRWG